MDACLLGAPGDGCLTALPAVLSWPDHNTSTCSRSEQSQQGLPNLLAHARFCEAPLCTLVGTSLIMAPTLQSQVLPCPLCHGSGPVASHAAQQAKLTAAFELRYLPKLLAHAGLGEAALRALGPPGGVQPQPLGQACVLVGPEGGQEAGPDAEQCEVQRHAGAVLRAPAEA